MKKEKINVIDLAIGENGINLTNIHEWNTIEIISQITTDYDLFSGYADIECIIKKLFDNKYFKFSYIDSEDSDILEQTAEEVFEKEKIIKYYE